MSKVDGLRAMREARYEANQALAKAGTTSPTAAAAPRAPRAATAAKPAARKATAAESEPAPSSEGLCGHRAISGRTCTREQGHTAKSHRYS